MILEIEQDASGVTRLWMNRPEVRNAFNADLIREMTRAVEDLAENARVLVIGGRGPVFSAGADLDWMRSMASYSRDDNIADASALERMLTAIDQCPIPVVGRIQGAAIAGAAGIVACCDVAIAAESSQFAFTEVKIGLVPAIISPFVMRKVGYSFSRYAFLTAERFDAGRAFSSGLVHKVTPDDQLDNAVEQVVTGLLESGPEALRETRRLVDRIFGLDPRAAAELTVPMIAERRVSEEGQEGLSSFLEKRPPSWRR